MEIKQSEKNTIQIMDETIEAVEKIGTLLKKAKAELKNLEQDKKKIELEKLKLENERDNLEREKQKLIKETKQLEREKEKQDKKIGQMSEEQQELLEEYKKVKVELKKFMEVAAQAEESEYDFDRIRALLSIYTVLVSEIWQGQPHYRILYTLHGDKEEMSREELKNTLGIGGAYILHSVQELARAGLLEYDSETGKAKLKERLFPKKALKKKEGTINSLKKE
jgi:chromosome segregation ATPase